MEGLNLLINLILEKYIIENSLWTNCIMHFAPYSNLTSIKPVDNTTNYIFTSTSYFDSVNERCDLFIIWDKSVTVLENIEQYIHEDHALRYNNRKFIIIDDTVDIFKSKSLHYIVDLILIHCDRKNVSGICSKYKLYTHRYATASEMQYNEPVLLDAFDSTTQTFENGGNLFMDKISKQNGRPLRIATSNLIPYSDIETLTGSNFKVALEYAAYHKNSIRINNHDEYNSSLPTNWTGTRMLNGLANDEFDVGIRSLFILLDRYRKFDASAVLTRVQLLLIVPKSKHIDSWKTFIDAFAVSTWILLISSLIAEASILLIIKKLNFVQDKCFNTFFTFSIPMQQPLPMNQLPRRTILRAFIILLFIQGILVSAMYNSHLASKLIDPQYIGEINTIEDFAKSNYLWGSTDENTVAPLAADERKWHKMIYEKFRVMSFDEMKHLTDLGLFGVMANIYASGYWSTEGYLNQESVTNYIPLKENAFEHYSCGYLRRSSVLTESFTMFAMYARDVGLLDFWERESIYSKLETPLQRYLNNAQNENKFRTLKLESLISVFVILLSGLGLSIFIFFVEIGKKLVHKTL